VKDVEEWNIGWMDDWNGYPTVPNSTFGWGMMDGLNLTGLYRPGAPATCQVCEKANN